MGTNSFIFESFRTCTAILAFIGLSHIAIAQNEPVPLKQGEVQLSDDEADELIASIKEIVAEAGVVLNSQSSTRLQPAAALEAANYEAAEIFDWVKSETRWVPYQGILRGPEGVLMDRRGNSLDRSLLLSSLLEDAGFETRLVRKRLSLDEATNLFQQYVSGKVGTPGIRVGLAESKLVRSYQQEVKAQALDLARLTGIKTDAANADFSEEHLTNIADHWWVQLKRGSGWQSLDLMLENSVDGADLTGTSFHSRGNLPTDLFHRLSVQLVIERWEDGQSVEESALAHDFSVADLPIFSQFEIRIVPFATEWMNFDESSPGLDAHGIASSAEFWWPSLSINGQTISGSWFNDAGRFEIPAVIATAVKLQEATAALSVLGEDLQPDDQPDSNLTAAWLEFRTSDPSGHSEIVRRELFDLLGIRRGSEKIRNGLEIIAAERLDRGLALQTQISNLVLTSMPHSDALDQSLLETWVEYREAFIALVYLAAGRDDDRVPLAIEQTEAKFPTYELLKIAAIRDLWSTESDYIYIDRPNVFSTHQVYMVRDGKPNMEFHNDIILNHVGVAPGATRGPQLMRIEQGVLDTLAETVVSGNENSLNTYRHFAQRSNGGRDWITNVAGLWKPEVLNSFPDGDKARIDSAVRTGSAVVVSPETYPVGEHQFASWWRIDMSDGSSLGHGYRGWGADTGEYGATTTIQTGATRQSAKKAGEQFHCRAFYAIMDITQELTISVDVTQEIDAGSLKKKLVQDAGGRMAYWKGRASALKTKILNFLGFGKPLC